MSQFEAPKLELCGGSPIPWALDVGGRNQADEGASDSLHDCCRHALARVRGVRRADPAGRAAERGYRQPRTNGHGAGSDQRLQRGGRGIRGLCRQGRRRASGAGRRGRPVRRKARGKVQCRVAGVQAEERRIVELRSMKSWTIRQRIVANFAIVLALMVVTGLIALRDLENIDARANNAANSSVPGLYASTAVQAELIVNYSLTAEYLGQTDVLRVKKIEEALQANEKRWEEAVSRYAALPSVASAGAAFGRFQATRAAYMATQREMLKLSAELDTGAANQIWRAQLSPQFEQARAAIQAVVDDNKAAADAAMREIPKELGSAHVDGDSPDVPGARQDDERGRHRRGAVGLACKRRPNGPRAHGRNDAPRDGSRRLDQFEALSVE